MIELTRTKESLENEEYWEQYENLKVILKNISLDEELRLIKIIKEMLKTDAISLKFIETLFFAIQETEVSYNPPEILLDLETDFYTLKCDVEKGRVSINEFIQEIEKVLDFFKQKKNRIKE